MPVSITLVESPSNNRVVVFPSQIIVFNAVTPSAYRPNAATAVRLGDSHGVYSNSYSDLIAATSGLCIPLTLVSLDGTIAFPPRPYYRAIRTIRSFTAVDASVPFFGTPGVNTRVEIAEENGLGESVYVWYISETVDQIRAAYDGTVMPDAGYVRSVRICDGPELTGNITIPCHVTGVTIGSNPAVLRGVVNIPQPASGVASVSLGTGLPETGQVNIPVGSTSSAATLISGTELSAIRNNIANPPAAGVSSLRLGDGGAQLQGAVTIPVDNVGANATMISGASFAEFTYISNMYRQNALSALSFPIEPGFPSISAPTFCPGILIFSGDTPSVLDFNVEKILREWPSTGIYQVNIDPVYILFTYAVPTLNVRAGISNSVQNKIHSMSNFALGGSDSIALSNVKAIKISPFKMLPFGSDSTRRGLVEVIA
jgi:hypothetical protein